MKFALVLILTTVIALGGCSDDSTAPHPPHTFTLELSADPFGAREDGGLAWVSDPDGDLLATATWSADTTLVFDLGNDAPDTISYTLAVSNRDELAIRTEFDVPVGATRRMVHDSEPSMERSAEIRFENAPPCQSSMLSYQGGSQGLSSGMLNDLTFYFYTEQVDVFVRLDPESGPPLGAWLRGVVDGEVYTLDFAADGVTEELTAYPVSLPEGCSNFMSSLGAWLDSGSKTGLVAFDRQDIEGELPSTVSMHTPQWPESGLASSMYLTRQGSPTLHYSQYVMQARPTAFVCLPGDLTVTVTAPASVSFTMTGDWDLLHAAWTQSHDLHGSWWISGSSPRSEVILPQLPDEFLEAYPDYTRQGFVLADVELTRSSDQVTRSVMWWHGEAKDGGKCRQRTSPRFSSNPMLESIRRK